MTSLNRLRKNYEAEGLGRLSPRREASPVKNDKTSPEENGDVISIGSPHHPFGSIKGYRVGELVFWDRNGDGRFRWIDRDFVTGSEGKRVRRSSVRIRKLLQEMSLHSTRELNPIWRAPAAYRKKMETLHPKTEKEKLAEFRLQFEERMEELEDAIYSGDWKVFNASLQDLKVFLYPYGIQFKPASEEYLKNRARFHGHLLEAAESLVRGRPDMAVLDLQFARTYAEKLEMEWDPEDVTHIIQTYLPDPITDETLDEVFRQLKEANP